MPKRSGNHRCTRAWLRTSTWLRDDDEIEVVAPFGLDDVFAMRLRPNPLLPVSRDWDRVVASAVRRWPELVVDAVVSAGPG